MTTPCPRHIPSPSFYPSTNFLCNAFRAKECKERTPFQRSHQLTTTTTTLEIRTLHSYLIHSRTSLVITHLTKEVSCWNVRLCRLNVVSISDIAKCHVSELSVLPCVDVEVVSALKSLCHSFLVIPSSHPRPDQAPMGPWAQSGVRGPPWALQTTPLTCLGIYLLTVCLIVLFFLSPFVIHFFLSLPPLPFFSLSIYLVFVYSGELLPDAGPPRAAGPWARSK